MANRVHALDIHAVRNKGKVLGRQKVIAYDDCLLPRTA